jgi:hypothetical protein
MSGLLITQTPRMRQAGINSTLRVCTISEVHPFDKLISGFGNVSYIGFLPIELYRAVNLDTLAFESEFTQQT